MTLLDRLRQMEREDGIAMRSLTGTQTHWCVEASDAGLDQRDAPELDDETGFELLELDAAAPRLAGDEVVFIHRHHDYEFCGGFYLDLSG